MTRVRLAWDLFRAEGARGLSERLAERVAGLRERRAERAVTPAELLPPGGAIPVLDVLATPLAPRFGGVPVQFAPRLAQEQRLRATALLAPESGRWVLRTARGGDRRRAWLGPCRAGSDARRGLGAHVPTIVEAAERVGAHLVNLEGLAGWPPDALGPLAGGERKLVLSLHDFALFCPRPNLVEEPHARFCGYSRDADRCRACLAETWSFPPGASEEWRRAAAVLLAASDAAVYPSDFLRRAYAELFPGAAPPVERVVAPPSPEEDPDRRATPGPAPRGTGRPLHVAFVGAYRPHKGALVFEDVVRRMAASSTGAVRWSILGSGDPALLLRARRLGIRVRGHYRAGSLSRRLMEDGVDVALLLSVWPETFALTLSECRAAGVPALAFGLGAIADRIGSEGGGLLVPPEEGAEGVVAALGRVLAGSAIPPFHGAGPVPAAARAAAERVALYRLLLGEEP
ncbi:MAG: glycosyltransferase [Thermoanaerobaculia bacterium]